MAAAAAARRCVCCLVVREVLGNNFMVLLANDDANDFNGVEIKDDAKLGDRFLAGTAAFLCGMTCFDDTTVFFLTGLGRVASACFLF